MRPSHVNGDRISFHFRNDTNVLVKGDCETGVLCIQNPFGTAVRSRVAAEPFRPFFDQINVPNRPRGERDSFAKYYEAKRRSA